MWCDVRSFVVVFPLLAVLGACPQDDEDVGPSPTDLEPTETPQPTLPPLDGTSIFDIQQGQVFPGDPILLPEVVVTSPVTPSGTFFVQEIGGGPYSGIFVRPPSLSTINLEPGQLLSLWGTYQEEYGVSTFVLESDGAIVELGQTYPPEPELVSPSDIATGGPLAEAYEGVLVAVEDVKCTNSNPDYPEDYGEFAVTGGLRVDGMFFEFYERMIPYPGDSFDRIAGVLHYDWNNTKLEPRPPDDIVAPRPYVSPQPDAPFVVTWLDVGQGDAALYEFPGGEVFLVDGGPEGCGYWDVLPLLSLRGIEAIDVLVATHPDADHIGGLDEVLEWMPTTEVWDNGETNDTDAYSSYVEARDASGASLRIPKQGNSFTYGDVQVKVLHGNQGSSGDNNDSLVLMFTYKNTKIMSTGDIESGAQSDLVEDWGSALECDAMSVPHHGSPNSNSKFVSTASPTYAVISVGAYNSYGHPDADTMEDYLNAGATLCRTDQSGDIALESNGSSLTFDCLEPIQ